MSMMSDEGMSWCLGPGHLQKHAEDGRQPLGLLGQFQTGRGP